MTTKPLFSIITVTLNHLDGLKKTISSLQNQNFKDFEHIIIDGCSNDGTQNYLNQLDALHISEKDNGIYDAMNKGLERTQGQYLIFMNAGDCFADNNILSKISTLIDKEKPDFIYGDALEDCTRYKKARDHSKITQGMITHHQAMIYNTAIVENIRYNTAYNIAADYDFTLNIIKKSKIISYLNQPICIFESDGISQQNVMTGRAEQFSIRRLHGHSWWKSGFIFVAQSVLYGLRKIMPRLYWRLKQH